MRFLSIILMAFLMAFPVSAKEEEPKPESSPTHVIGFTFHKLAGTKPDYTKWVDVYLEGKLQGYGEEGAREQIRQTRLKFVNNFNNFHLVDNEEIIVVLPAKVEIVPFEAKYLMNVSVDGGLDFIIKETPERLINLVVPDLEDKLKPVISRDDYKDIKKASGLKFEKPEIVNLVLKLKPVSVDADKPIQVHGKEYWLMLMEFETYEIWHFKHLKKYWTYITEEEKQQKLDELRSLYKTDEGGDNLDQDLQFIK